MSAKTTSKRSTASCSAAITAGQSKKATSSSTIRTVRPGPRARSGRHPAISALEYDHKNGIAITGGFVYRGTAMPELFGKYIFGDLALIPSPIRINGRLFY